MAHRKLLRDQSRPVWGCHLGQSAGFAASNLGARHGGYDSSGRLLSAAPWISWPYPCPSQVAACRDQILLAKPCPFRPLTQAMPPYISWDLGPDIQRPDTACGRQRGRYLEVERCLDRSSLWEGRSLESLYWVRPHLQLQVGFSWVQRFDRSV